MANKEYLIMKLDVQKNELTLLKTFKYGSSAVRYKMHVVEDAYQEMIEKKSWMNYKTMHFNTGCDSIGYYALDFNEEEEFHPIASFYIVIRDL